MLARRQLVVLRVGPNDVVGLACGHPLSELTSVVGIELPAGFFLVGTADLDLDAVDGPPVGIKDGSEDQSVGYLRSMLGLTARRSRIGWHKESSKKQRSEDRYEKA